MLSHPQVILRRFAATHRCSCALLASVLRLLRAHTHERCEAVVALWSRLMDRSNILNVSISSGLTWLASTHHLQGTSRIVHCRLCCNGCDIINCVLGAVAPLA